MQGKLFILATPIGNLEDITLRGLRILKEADGVIAEDTRVTQKLLSRYGLNKPIFVFHQHSSLREVEKIAALLEAGKNLVLVTDAGTPGISDPGGRLIQGLVEKTGEALEIIPLPGPNAALVLLSVSGFPADRFIFLGFPPHKKRRQSFFREIAEAKYTVVFYESPHRILKTLKEIAENPLLSSRSVAVGRELTKKFETIYRGMAGEILKKHRSELERGEITVAIRSAT